MIYAGDDDIPDFERVPKDHGTWPSWKADDKILEKFNAHEAMKCKSLSSLNKDLKIDDCHIIFSYVKFAKEIDRLMSHNGIKYRVFKSSNNLYLYVIKDKYIDAKNAIQAAINVELIERYRVNSQPNRSLRIK